MLKYIIIICLFLNGCTAYKHNQLQKEIIKKQQSWLNIQYLAMKKPQLTNKKGTMEYKLKDKTNKDCPKCNSKLYNEIIKEIDYPYVCLDCDENFYNFETEKELCKN